MKPTDDLRDNMMSGTVREDDVRAFRETVGEEELQRLNRSERLVRESLQRASSMQTSDSFVARLQARLETLPKRSPLLSLVLRWSMPLGVLTLVASLIFVIQLMPHASTSGMLSTTDNIDLFSADLYMRAMSSLTMSLYSMSLSTSVILTSISLAVVLGVWLSLPDSTISGHHGRHNAVHRSS